MVFPRYGFNYRISSWAKHWRQSEKKNLYRILENVEYLRSKFQRDLGVLLKKSGIDEKEVEADRIQIVEKFSKSIALIKGYRLFVAIFSICALAICIHFIIKIS